MSRPRKEAVFAAVTQGITVLLLSLGLALPALKALLPAQALWPAAVWCAVLSLGFELLYLLPLPRKGWFVFAALLGLGAWGALGGGPVHTAIQMLKAAYLSLRGIPDAAMPYADAARFTVCLFFTLLAGALAWDDALPLAVFSVITVLALIFILSGQEGLLLWALPAAAGLLVMMAEGKERRVSPLPIAVFLAALAFLCMPAQPRTVQPLDKWASDLRQLVEDYLFFNDQRASFSLESEGYQPLKDRLGGPASPSDHPVMEVETGRTLLLRGKTYDTYTGLGWVDTLSSRRYLYASPRFTALRENILDLSRPLTGHLPEQETAHIRMLGGGTTTLFAPSHTRTLQTESDRMVLYFNQASELFITRNTQADDSYTVTYLPAAAESAQTAALAAACANVSDPFFADIRDAYLKLPAHIQQEIFDIAHKAAGSAQTPYEKALNIMRYLRSHYRYNLNVAVQPDGVDFVAWFLIGEKAGYCTAFATAMTVLCRIEGVPARYVTGYVASPDSSGTAHVTGQEAHAWTEVYLNGYGWLAVDATPRSQDEPTNEDPPTPPAPTPTPEPSPEPSPMPTATPSPDEDDAPQTPTPSPDEPQSPDNTPTPTPRPDGAATPTPPPDQPSRLPEDQDGDKPFPYWLLALLLLLLIAAALVWRYLRTEPIRRAHRKKDDAAVLLFSEICALLRARGLQRGKAETLHSFAARADAQLAGQNLPALWPLTQQLTGQVYGRHAAPSAPFEAAYLAIRKQSSVFTRFRLAARRMLRPRPSMKI